jgi:glycosyltransferase involved in cell wall biosynthesis
MSPPNDARVSDWNQFGRYSFLCARGFEHFFGGDCPAEKPRTFSNSPFLLVVQRILIDISRLLYRRLNRHLPTGIDRVSLEYLRHYLSGARAVLSLGPFSALMSEADSAKVFSVLLDGSRRESAFLVSLVAKAVLWRWACRGVSGAFLFNTGHLGLEDPHHGWSLRRLGVRPIFVVHDLIPLTHPEYCRPGERERHEVRMRNAIKLGHGIIAVSSSTLEVLAEFARMRSLRLPPAVVARLAPGLPMLESKARPIDTPYFLVLGTIEPRKNHWLLLQLWRRLVERMGKGAPKLVIIGQRGWECENVVDLLERCEQLKGFVVERTRCSDAELVTYLQHARALLFPSFAEGYGLPVTEALSHGVPVIASDLAVFREVAGEVPDYIDPLDGRHWLAAIEDYASESGSARNAQLARMQNFRAGTWQDHLKIVDNFLVELDRPQS